VPCLVLCWGCRLTLEEAIAYVAEDELVEVRRGVGEALGCTLLPRMGGAFSTLAQELGVPAGPTLEERGGFADLEDAFSRAFTSLTSRCPAQVTPTAIR